MKESQFNAAWKRCPSILVTVSKRRWWQRRSALEYQRNAEHGSAILSDEAYLFINLYIASLI
ncbi:hypothetical protein IEQ34_011667 [Dendrobium chrysotoxum]|uniref:Uncharacterized protein n=1 Tax=Dendrobium chrysotoxum TaxID=161865 RepID=A0AAV7GT98_DENCH|nr:hypothetical protein IEQ34_011667 [Dendrobium chrysotoxum]